MPSPRRRQKPSRSAAKGSAAKPSVRLLSGGNPQIAKADGPAAIRAYLAAMPGWKKRVGKRIDTLITRAVPGLRRAVKWNSPFYGTELGGWIVSFHCYTNYVKVAFFRGVELSPPLPGGSKSKLVRYLDVREDDVVDARLFSSWVRQAARLPGWNGR